MQFDKTLYERNIYVLLVNLRLIVHILSTRIVNLLNCWDNFSNIKLTDAKTKYRSFYILDVS